MSAVGGASVLRANQPSSNPGGVERLGRVDTGSDRGLVTRVATPLGRRRGYSDLDSPDGAV